MTSLAAAVLVAVGALLIGAVALLLRRYVEERAEELAGDRVGRALTGMNERVRVVSHRLEHALSAAAQQSAPSKPDALAATLDLDELLCMTLEAAKRIARVDAVALRLEDIEEKPVVATLGLSVEEAAQQALAVAADGREARSIALAYQHASAEDEPNGVIRAGVAVPVSGPTGRRGLLSVFTRSKARTFDDDDIGALEALVARAAPAIENARRFREARRLTDVDSHTGLRNRRFFDQALEREVARATRYRRRLALVALTSEGDLEETAQRVRGHVRATDLACLIADKELAIILPEAGANDASRVPARIGRAGGRPLEAGVAELQPQETAISLLRRARESLSTQARSGDLP